VTEVSGLATAFGVPLLRTRIPKDVKVRDAANLDAAVGQIFPISRAGIMYRMLAEEVMEAMSREPDAIKEAVS
jgi:hypothetical protein